LQAKSQGKKFSIIQQILEQIVQRAPRINDPEAQLFSFLLLVVMKKASILSPALINFRN
jgi:hypothetical protein